MVLSGPRGEDRILYERKDMERVTARDTCTLSILYFI